MKKRKYTKLIIAFTVVLVMIFSVITVGASTYGANVITKSVIHTTEEKDEPPVMLVFYYDNEDIINMAKLLYRECGGVKNVTEQACVAWIACNWADAENDNDYVGMISESIKSAGRFAYSRKAPVTDHLYSLAADVLFRWNLEKNGYQVVGRVIPSDYLYFGGDGRHNYFRRQFRGDRDFWDYSLTSPYDLAVG